MDKEQFKQMGNNPDFIPGIYNYCDRWCQRCPFTTKCSLYATEQEQFPDDASRDITNEQFWNHLQDLFAMTVELLKDSAEEHGMDLEESEQHRAEKQRQAAEHPAAKTARTYITNVDEWFEQSDQLFQEKGTELSRLAELDLPEQDVADSADEIRDYVEVIRWYKYQISAKIMRALRGKMDELLPEEDPVQNDNNGSAKVALLGIDRSIAAWGGLMKAFPDQEDSILAVLVQLEHLKGQLDQEFPNARKFKRPGFDEQEQMNDNHPFK